jgi:hypothetical protein
MSAAVARLGRMPRAEDFGPLHETLLMTGVATILVIRTQLWLTHYPQLGGRGLHIAHLLWGGMFMLIAIGLLLTFLGRPVRRLAAIVGGVGFGFFIDELGKFITADNNYFFKPAAALIYLIFVGLFLLMRRLQRQRDLSPSERLANAIELVGEAARGRFSEPDRRRALALLDGADPTAPLLEPVRRVVEGIEAPPPAQPSWVVRLAAAMRARYFRIVERDWFRPVVALVLVIWASGSVIAVFELVLSLGLHVGGAMAGYRSDAVGDLHVVNVASLASSVVSAWMVLVGLRRLRAGARLDAYREFQRALLVSIFVTRVFSFVESQFAAVFGLGVDLLMLVTVGAMANQERRLRDSSLVVESTGERAVTTT